MLPSHPRPAPRPAATCRSANRADGSRCRATRPSGPGHRAVLAVALTLTLAPATPALGQNARIWEDTRVLRTYPFSEPDAVPILERDARLYPYHAFAGYAAESEPRAWNVVTLENDHIQVFVLPEVGGKVWGAVVRETGHEFIYRNEVMKFRNIALRGPWTSGGIEFNFGVIGHTPATATPVDYRLVENGDGSVSCWVGGMDLPSRTHWRVEVRLEPGRASFDTNVFWYNPTPLEQPYYNWMTAAAFARDDLVLSIPGNAYLTHPGQARPWPVDAEGRTLPVYAENRFDGHKSYHVVGELNDFFGGYYADAGYGFGHWARYEDMPGQKLWLWALSRQGGVWEDLLTDTDGQYVEFQAGRLFVQYQPGTEVNPITQAGFDPLSSSRWTESWFPVEGIGGLTDASRDGALHAVRDGGMLRVAVNAFRAVEDTLRVWSGDSLVHREAVRLAVLEPLAIQATVDPGLPYRVQVPALGLDYTSDPSERTLSRPFETDPVAFPSMSDAARAAFEGRELAKGRRYTEARARFEAALAAEPWNRDASVGLAEMEVRSARYEAALEAANRALQLDAYDARANFAAGVAYRALGRTADARDAFGWAVRSTGTRAAGYGQLAEMLLGRSDPAEAIRYARLALDYDRTNVSAWQVLAVAGRTTGDPALSAEATGALLGLDPLHHLVAAERYLTAASSEAAHRLRATLMGEYPDQTLLELATTYVRLGLPDDARALLSVGLDPGVARATASPDGTPAGALEPQLGALPLLRAWAAWLDDDPAALGPVDVRFTFPYRAETLPVLRWAVERDGHWTWRYLLALELWSLDRPDEARAVMADLGQEPDAGFVYAARGALDDSSAGVETDLERAASLDAGDRLLHVRLVRHRQDAGDWAASAEALATARSRFPDDFNLVLLDARTRLHLGRADEAADLLDRVRVLPSENSRESHRLYALAHTYVGLDALEDGNAQRARRHLEAALEWPETLGQGRPYDPEERLVRYLLATAHRADGRAGPARAELERALDASGELPSADAARATAARADTGPRLDLLGIAALYELDRADEAVAAGWPDTRAELATLVRQDLASWFTDVEGGLILRAMDLRTDGSR